MKKQTYFIIGTAAVITFIVACFVLFGSLRYWGNPTGSPGPDYPYFITTQPIVVKKILLPAGTKLTYEEQLFKKGEQKKIMKEELLTSLQLPEGQSFDWGGVPVYMIAKYFNSEMRGYTVYADFSQLEERHKTVFSELWQRSDCDLGIDVKDITDWSFDKANIIDIQSCGINYQRSFKEDKKQQEFLDRLYNELKGVIE